MLLALGTALLVVGTGLFVEPALPFAAELVRGAAGGQAGTVLVGSPEWWLWQPGDVAILASKRPVRG